MNCKDTSLLRVVRGNGFKLKIAVEAYTPSGRKVESFSVDEAELKLYKNGTLTAKEYSIIERTTILVEFDGTDALGIYGLQMEGNFEDEAWRWANWKVFQIVETNEKANIPEGCVVLEDTYLIGVSITLSNGDFTQEQADWDETDPESPAYIQNKPDLSRYLTSAYELLTVGVTLDSTSGKYTFDTPLYGLLDSAWSAGKIPVLRLRDSSSQQIRIIATIPMFPGGVTGNASFYGVEQKGETKYVFAYVGSLTQAANSYAKVEDVQSVISDLDAIRSGAALGATALQEAYELLTVGVTLDSTSGKYTFDTPLYGLLDSAWSAGKIPVLRLRDSSSQQIRIIATIPMFPGGVTGNASFYGVEQKGETKYVFAYVGSLTQAANSYAKVVDVQSAISDLDAIRSGAALGATALQEAFVIIDGGTKTKMGTTYNFTTGTITAIKNAWDAGKVPVLVCTLVDDDVKFVAVISKNAENKFFGEFFVNSTRYQFTSLEYSQFATGSISIVETYQKPSGGIPSSDLSQAVQTSLGKADTALQEESVFVAEYEVTSYNDIVSAATSGKAILVRKSNNNLYSRISYGSNEYVFGCIYYNSVFEVIQCDSSGWSTLVSYNNETKNNKTDDISANKTSTLKYPSTKGVADYVDGIVGDINTILDNINGEVI